MDIATGAMNNLLPKLGELVVGEYKPQKGVKEEIKELENELRSMTVALRKVAEVPVDQLDELVKIWASDVRELSYDIEDAVDTFMLRGMGHEPTMPFSFKGFLDRAINLFKEVMANHQIHNVIKDIMRQVNMINERRKRYKVDDVPDRPIVETIDPRMEGMYRKPTELVGIGQPKNELAKRLLQQNCSSRQQSNIISIVGFGGLGKTTLANSLFQDLKAKFDCHFFVSVSLNPDIKKILRNTLLQLDEKRFACIDEGWEVKQLIDKIIEFLKNRRCLCVIDDLWKELPWDIIKIALQDGNSGSKIIITTRNKAVAEHVGGDIYELKRLSIDDSRELFYKRIFDSVDDCPAHLSKVTEKILKKCGGVPLAIITTASLLATKPRCSVEWEVVNNFIGSGSENSPHVDKMNKILSLSYNDLPFHLKTCLLSLSKYPEDHVIRKDVLVWSWIAEGFIRPAGSTLLEIGEGYFNELINRCLIQPVNSNNPFYVLAEREVYACRLHDMVLEFIIKLSVEEGFASTSLSDGARAGSSAAHLREIIRRLSLHNSSNNNASINARNQLSKVRSLDVFGHADLMPALSRFSVLRVLQIEDCSDLDQNHLKDLSNLYLLRFLRLKGLKVTKLPETIGKLESLETLDIRGAKQESVILLPVSFCKLGKLVRLLAETVELPDGVTLENMKSLQELVGIRPSLHTMTEIGKLRELKVLELNIDEACKNCTSNLHKLIPMCVQMCPSLLQALVLRTPTYYSLDSMAQIPSGLQTLMCGGFFSAFPRWIDPSLSCLTTLSIMLRNVVVQPEHLDKLAQLPSLRFLRLFAPFPRNEQEVLVIPSTASSFPCLTDFRLFCPLMFLKFQHGTMRKLQRLCLKFDARWTNELLLTNNYFDYGLENLISLRHVVVSLWEGCPEQDNAIRKTVNDHPNHPSLYLSTY